MNKIILVVLLFWIGCGGPNLYFDPGPAPAWTQRVDCWKTPTGMLMAVGSAPATQRVAEDLKLARYDAISRIAQMISSELSAVTSYWQTEVNTGKSSGEMAVINKDIRIRSRIRVSDIKVVRRYRDKATSMAYVMVAVDTGQWISKIERGLKSKTNALQQITTSSKELIGHKRVLSAFSRLNKAWLDTQNTQSDLLVLYVLAPHSQVGQRLTRLRERIHRMLDMIKQDIHFRIALRCPSTQAAKEIRGNILQFLMDQGFTATDRGKWVVRIDGWIKTRRSGRFKIGYRKETRLALDAGLTVRDANGQVIGPLSFRLPPNRYFTHDTNKIKAMNKAIDLGMDLIVAGFTSRFRRFMHRGTSR
jgi:hypothetical protein